MSPVRNDNSSIYALYSDRITTSTPESAFSVIKSVYPDRRHFSQPVSKS